MTNKTEQHKNTLTSILEPSNKPYIDVPNSKERWTKHIKPKIRDTKNREKKRQNPLSEAQKVVLIRKNK